MFRNKSSAMHRPLIFSGCTQALSSGPGVCRWCCRGRQAAQHPARPRHGGAARRCTCSARCRSQGTNAHPHSALCCPSQPKMSAVCTRRYMDSTLTISACPPGTAPLQEELAVGLEPPARVAQRKELGLPGRKVVAARPVPRRAPPAQADTCRHGSAVRPGCIFLLRNSSYAKLSLRGCETSAGRTSRGARPLWQRPSSCPSCIGHNTGTRRCLGSAKSNRPSAAAALTTGDCSSAHV